MSDYTDHKYERQQWEANVRDYLLPRLQNSAVSMVLVPASSDTPDVKIAVELGLSILLDKPIVLVVIPGRTVPAKLAKLADAIVEADPNTATGQTKLNEFVADKLQKLIDP